MPAGAADARARYGQGAVNGARVWLGASEGTGDHNSSHGDLVGYGRLRRQIEVEEEEVGGGAHRGGPWTWSEGAGLAGRIALINEM